MKFEVFEVNSYNFVGVIFVLRGDSVPEVTNMISFPGIKTKCLQENHS